MNIIITILKRFPYLIGLHIFFFFNSGVCGFPLYK